MKKIWSVLILMSFKSLAFPLEAKNGKTEFTAIGRPAAIKIIGHGAGPTGDMNLARKGDDWMLNGKAILDLDSFNTGIDLRDQHMKEKYLETGKTKTASLEFLNAAVPAGVIEKGGDIKLPAVLSLRGIEKPVEVQVNFTDGKEGLRAISQFHIQISDFAIPVPSFSGITVADKVQIKVESLIAKTVLASESLEKK